MPLFLDSSTVAKSQSHLKPYRRALFLRNKSRALNNLLPIAFAQAPVVQCLPMDVVEDGTGHVSIHLRGHEALPVVEELELVVVGSEDASPRLGPASTGEELDWTAAAELSFNLHNFMSD